MNTQYRVIANFRSVVAVENIDGVVERAAPISKLPQLVSGDLVRCEREIGGSLRAVELIERKSALTRPDRRGQAKPLAANVTHLAIISAAPPGIDTLLVDQFCVAAELAGIDAMIVINKADLLSDDDRQSCEAMLAVYRRIGYSAVMIDTKTEGALQSLEEQLADKTVVLVGASGVGKSSIVQQLLPDLDVRVGAISKATGAGSHTTTVTFWYDLPIDGAAIIDSPGVRQYSVAHLRPKDVRVGYREITDAAAGCKFTDCSHVIEPGCAVVDALANGEIANWRYANYRKLAEL